MEFSSFFKLCSIISPQVQVNDEMSRHRTGKDSVIVEIMLHFLLRWLGGGSYLDLRLSAGISKAALYNYMYKYMDAILDSEALAHKFMSTTKELDIAAQGLESLSSHGAIKGCVPCLNGFLCAFNK